MNFQAVDQNNGENVTMWATLSKWEGIAFTTNQAKYLSCKLVDDNGVEHKCRIYEGKGTLPGQECLNQRLEFNISSYQGNYKGQPYTGYSGFWSHGATKGSQNTQQAPSQPAQATNYQQPAPQGKKEPAKEDDAYKMVRDNVTCSFIQSGELKLDDLSIEVATAINKWVNFILKNDNPNYVGDNPPRPVDDDIPF